MCFHRLNQIYNNPDDRKAAQDSIDRSLKQWDKKLWVPSLEELEKAREAREAKAAGKTVSVDENTPLLDEDGNVISAEETGEKVNSRVAKKKTTVTKKAVRKTKVKKASAPKSAPAQSSATRSVRNRRR